VSTYIFRHVEVHGKRGRLHLMEATNLCRIISGPSNENIIYKKKKSLAQLEVNIAGISQTLTFSIYPTDFLDLDLR